MRRLSPDQARRIALAAQGLARPKTNGRVDVRHFRSVLDQVRIVQLDSVNAFSRTHYLPFFARLGPYDRDKLDTFAAESGEAFEYWGHEASWMRIRDYPNLRHRMEAIKPWRRIRHLMDEAPGYIEAVHEEVVAKGPMTVSDLDDPGERTGPWWGYGDGKSALEWLFAKGRVASYRRPDFKRVYDLPERVIDPSCLAHDPVPPEDAKKELLVAAAAAHGIGTAKDLADYYRIHLPTSRPLLEQLAADGRLLEVDVFGWSGPAYLHPEATIPRHTNGAALLSPFDSLIWERDRTERIFGFRYRIEIYVPKPKRVHGYYVLPFLLDGHLVGRVDLKSDRAGNVLRVPGAFVEEGHDPVRVARAMAGELQHAAAWLGFDDVVVGRKGSLTAPLRAALG